MFITNKRDKGVPEPFEYFPVTTSESVVLGEALKLSSGKLTKCSGANKPEFIAMQPITSAAAGAKIAVIRVQPDVEYETQLSAELASPVIGTKYTIDSDGLKMTATTTNGVCELISYDGTAAGSKVRVRF